MFTLNNISIPLLSITKLQKRYYKKKNRKNPTGTAKKEKKIVK